MDKYLRLVDIEMFLFTLLPFQLYPKTKKKKKKVNKISICLECKQTCQILFQLFILRFALSRFFALLRPT